MDNKGKHKSRIISDKINISMQADAYIGTHVELASHLRLSVSMLNTTVRNYEEIESYYTECGPLSKQHKSLKCSPLEELESALAAWCKQACESNAFIDGTHLKEALHIATRLGIANFAIFQWVDQQISEDTHHCSHKSIR
jgi:hypothetical protein